MYTGPFAGGISPVRVKIGNTRAFDRTATGRALTSTLTEVPTAWSPQTNWRRLDPKYEGFGAAAIPGYAPGETIEVLMTGFIQRTDKVHPWSVLPDMQGGHDGDSMALKLSGWLAEMGLGQNIQVTPGQDKSFKLGPQNASYSCLMTQFTFPLPAALIPTLLAAHDTKSLIVDVAGKHEVKAGRMRIILKEATTTQGLVATRVRIHLHLHDEANPLGLHTQPGPNKPLPPPLLQLTMLAAAAVITLADNGKPFVSKADWAAYVAGESLPSHMRLLRSLSPVLLAYASDQETATTPYVVHSASTELQDMLDAHGSLKVEAEGAFTLTITAADLPSASSLGLPIRKHSGTQFTPADLLFLTHRIREIHTQPAEHPLHKLVRGQNAAGSNWRTALSEGRTRDVAFSSPYGEVITPRAGEKGRYFDIELQDPLTNKAKTLSTTAGSGAGATLAFCTEEGYPLAPQLLEERRTLLLLPGFRHDALNIIAAAQMEGGSFSWEGTTSSLVFRDCG
ncbi:hypothetical protein V8C86DRAFT_3124675 [Haematococcus lacustris]